MTREQIRRARGKVRPVLETLDERLAPAPMGLGAGVVHAAQVSKAKLKAKPNVKAPKAGSVKVQPAKAVTVAAKPKIVTTTSGNAKVAPVKVSNPTPTNAAPAVRNLAPAASAKLGTALTTIFKDYQVYIADGAQGAFQSSLGQYIQVIGNSVRVTIGVQGDLENAVQILSQNQATVETTSRLFNGVQALVPIDKLDAVANLGVVGTIAPVAGPFRS